MLLLGCICPLAASAENIAFIDENVKGVCVQNWDTDGDGELSMEEKNKISHRGKALRKMLKTLTE